MPRVIFFLIVHFPPIGHFSCTPLPPHMHFHFFYKAAEIALCHWSEIMYLSQSIIQVLIPIAAETDSADWHIQPERGSLLGPGKAPCPLGALVKEHCWRVYSNYLRILWMEPFFLFPSPEHFFDSTVRKWGICIGFGLTAVSDSLSTVHSQSQLVSTVILQFSKLHLHIITFHLPGLAQDLKPLFIFFTHLPTRLQQRPTVGW